MIRAAIMTLASLYRHGKGVDNDDARAAMHFQHAADLNYPPGLHNLGILYMTGTGVPQDVVRGVDSIVAAADAWYDPALYHMADLLFYGTGVQASEALALEYMEKAAEGETPGRAIFHVRVGNRRGRSARLPALGTIWAPGGFDPNERANAPVHGR